MKLMEARRDGLIYSRAHIVWPCSIAVVALWLIILAIFAVGPTGLGLAFVAVQIVVALIGITAMVLDIRADFRP